MSYAKISQVAHYVPDQVVTNNDLAQIMDTSDEWISSRTGIKERHISHDQQTSALATEVAKKLLAQSSWQASDLDFILVATITPDSMMPSTAARVQANIGASHAFAFDVTAACSGFIFALSTAEKLILSGSCKRGLVIGAEVLSKVIDWQDRRTAVLFGDGAGGVLIEASDQKHFLIESLHTDGGRGQALTSSYQGLASPFSVEEDSHLSLEMDGRAVFDFAIRDVVATIKETLSEADLSAEELDYFLLHQANDRMLDKMARKLCVDREKLPANMMRYGNTSAASVPILLSECIAEGKITLGSGQKLVLAGFGGGLTWGILLLTI
ncbi:beta-ketoacyl-ACP synthase III [Streptococcus moroccensis]|uniref:Beta-ketoacyl-[acyl-carrier-protein] synthase III n=1 Tax=Streptococcus moroccensis TaxID=1451356 RepID=A0ABT9YT23_9STRE|nr:beta-ketoacyl-ACP synthase III [Streptococcus moroccensis]MDQ0223123.1 3-oxoacyl-[acyl-carrier-protein] synthase-3 [Streptococcus moroccensis]